MSKDRESPRAKTATVMSRNRLLTTALPGGGCEGTSICCPPEDAQGTSSEPLKLGVVAVVDVAPAVWRQSTGGDQRWPGGRRPVPRVRNPPYVPDPAANHWPKLPAGSGPATLPILERFAADTQLRSKCSLGERVPNSVQSKPLGE